MKCFYEAMFCSTRRLFNTTFVRRDVLCDVYVCEWCLGNATFVLWNLNLYFFTEIALIICKFSFITFIQSYKGNNWNIESSSSSNREKKVSIEELYSTSDSSKPSKLLTTFRVSFFTTSIYFLKMIGTMVELLPGFKFTGKLEKNRI